MSLKLKTKPIQNLVKTKPYLIAASASLALGLSFLTTSCSDKSDEPLTETDVSSSTAVEESMSNGLKSPFESLPAETEVAVRFDNSAATRKEYVDSTKLGKLLFSDDKIEEYKAFIDQLIEGDEDAAKFVSGLEAIGLDLEDLYGMLSSHIGAALVKQPVEGFSPMPTLVLWAEMEQDVVDEAYSSILATAAEKETVERIDQDLSGVTGSRIRNAERGDSFLTVKLENRFILAIGFPVDVVTTKEEAEVFEDAEWEVLGAFVQAQQENGGEFLNSFYSAPGISAIRPDFNARLEALGDLTKLIDYIPAKSAQAVQLLNLRQFENFAAWSGLSGMTEKSVMFIGVPAPRSGLGTMIEAEVFDFSPPAWVPSAVNSYSSFSFDFAKLYEVAIGIAKGAMPPAMVDQQVAGANEKLQAALQIDLDTLFASFGGRMHIVEYPMETVTMNVGENTVDVPRSPSAFVIDFARSDILQKAVALANLIASNPQSGIQILDEQGFEGIRMQSQNGAVTIAHGQGKVIFSVGETAASRVFALLNNPPEGDDALVNNSDYRSFIADHNPKPGIGFSYSKGDNMLKNLTPVFKGFSNAMANATEEKDALLLESLLELLPSEEELEGLLGSVFTRVHYDESGLIIEGTNEYK